MKEACLHYQLKQKQHVRDKHNWEKVLVFWTFMGEKTLIWIYSYQIAVVTTLATERPCLVEELEQSIFWIKPKYQITMILLHIVIVE